MKVGFSKCGLLLGLILLVGCTNPVSTISGNPTASSRPGTPTGQPVPTSAPSTNVPSGTPILQPSATPSSGITPVESTPLSTPVESTPLPTPTKQAPARYTLDVSFDYFQHLFSVSERISYINLSSGAIPNLVLVVEPNLWQGGFTLDSITWENGEKISDYELNEDQLHIPLLQALNPGERLELIVSYRLDLPEIPAPSESVRPVPYGYTERQTNIVDWYPYFPPYIDGNGWLVHSKWQFGEHQVFPVADFDVRLTLVEPIQDLVIAASAPAVQDGDSYTYHLESARSFALSAGTEYSTQTTTVGNITVTSYYFPYDSYAGIEVLQNTADALGLFNNMLTPYPHTSLSVVEADFLDGMEYDGLFFLSHGFYDLYDGTPKGYLTFIAAHETAHQWFYGLVGNDQALEPWLDEALCTYMEHVFYENLYNDYSPSSGQSLVDWWWYYRVNFYVPAGWVDGSIYDFSQFRPYRDAIYLNGAKFLDELRSLVGDLSFFEFLRDYTTQNTHRIATGNDFFSILRQHTSKDLDGLLSGYFQQDR